VTVKVTDSDTDFTRAAAKFIEQEVGRDDLQHSAAYDALTVLLDNWQDAQRDNPGEKNYPRALVDDVLEVVAILQHAHEALAKLAAPKPQPCPTCGKERTP
jgi:hypothetical protein